MVDCIHRGHHLCGAPSSSRNRHFQLMRREKKNFFKFQDRQLYWMDLWER